MSQKVKCTWHLNRDCNFRCSYCYVSKQRNLNSQRGHGVDMDISAFRKNKVVWDSILLSGGEPFIYPDFVELCKKLSGFAHIEINTNCSTSNVFDFADNVDPKLVDEFHISFHIGQRSKDKWLSLVDKIVYLRDRGFPVIVSEVVHPRLIESYKKAFVFFKEKGICIVPKVFEGFHGFRVYPSMYRWDDRDLFYDYNKRCNVRTSPLIYGFLDWKGRLCDAGYSFMQIQYNGDAFRCQADRTYLGNLYKGDIEVFDKPRVCSMPLCTCAYEGMHYAHGSPNIHRTPFLSEYVKEAGMHYMNMFRGFFR